MKAALLSGLVFPGAGHIYLKRFLLGVLLSVGAASAGYVIVSSAVHTALEVVDEIQGGGIPLDAETITDLVSRRSRDNESTTNIATMVFVAFWLVGIVDSYRIGRAREKLDAVGVEKET